MLAGILFVGKIYMRFNVVDVSAVSYVREIIFVNYEILNFNLTLLLFSLIVC